MGWVHCHGVDHLSRLGGSVQLLLSAGANVTHEYNVCVLWHHCRKHTCVENEKKNSFVCVVVVVVVDCVVNG